MRRILLGIFTIAILIAPSASFAYTSGICRGDTCDAASTEWSDVLPDGVTYYAEVGVFMNGVSSACGNLGNCSLDDIMLVFVNLGNYVIGIIGAVVLLMYVIGGTYMLTSGGASDRVTKGKKYLTISTVGLLIVMFSFIGIYAIRGTLQYGAVSVTDQGYVVCTGEGTKNLPCGYNHLCTEEGTCETKCAITYAQTNAQSTTETFQCVDITSLTTGGQDKADRADRCVKNLCPGGDNQQCCPVAN